MPKYETVLETFASTYECMTLIPDSEPRIDRMRIEAKNDEEAKIISLNRKNDYIKERGYIGVRSIKIISIKEVRDVI